MTPLPLTRFLDRLHLLIAGRALVKLVLSNPRDTSSDLKSLTLSLVEIKKGIRLNAVYRYRTKDITKNFSPDEGLSLVKKEMEEEFLNADLFAEGEVTRLLVTPGGKYKLRIGKETANRAVSLNHDHVKERTVATEGNPWLRELGILNSANTVRPEMKDKYLQINRYIELVAPYIRELELPETVRVADMGSGKGYLTFALYDYLVRNTGKTIQMTGLEARQDLVALSNDIAARAGFTGLNFIRGTIRDAVIEDPDILIALHACDTATDDAIARGIRAGAQLIVCAPCCHKQVRKAMTVPPPLKAILKHGILLERQAEILTDGIRALVMEAHGYKTSVFEFISTEHTPKNLMIVAVKTKQKPGDREKLFGMIRNVKEMFGIGRHYLEEEVVSTVFSLTTKDTKLDTKRH